MRAAGELLAPEDLQHEIGAGDALHGFVSLPPAYPDRRCAIGHGHAGSGINSGQFAVAMRLHDAVHAGHADVTLAPRFELAGDTVQGEFHVKSFDGGAEQFGRRTTFGPIHMARFPSEAWVAVRSASASKADGGYSSER